MAIRFPFRKDGFPRQRARADRVVRPYKLGMTGAKRRDTRSCVLFLSACIENIDEQACTILYDADVAAEARVGQRIHTCLHHELPEGVSRALASSASCEASAATDAGKR